MSGTLKTVKPIKVIVMMILTFSPFSLPNTAVFGRIMEEHKSSKMSKAAGFSVSGSFSHLCNTEI